MANSRFYDKLDKVWTFTFDDGTVLTNEDIYMDGGVKLHQIMCDEAQLTYGLCVSDYIELTLINKNVSYIGQSFTVDVAVPDGSYSFNLGTFKVESEKVSSNKSSRKIVAYDGMMDIFNLDIADWYNSLTFPITLKNMRDSFFTYFNIPTITNTQTHVFDSMSLQKTINPESMTGKTFITALCEINRCWGMFHQGNFKFISLDPNFDNAYTIPASRIVSESHEDWETATIDTVQIRQYSDDIGAVAGDGTNAWIIEDNFFMYGLNATQLGSCATTLLNKVKNIKYTPIKMTTDGNPTLSLGLPINVTLADGTTLHTYVFKRTLKGPQALRDEIECNGAKTRDEEANGINEDIIQLKGKYNRLNRDVDGLTSEVYDSSTGVSRITQNAQAISAKVSAVGGNGASFGWNLTASGFVLTSNGNQVFKCDSGGITVAGYTTADEVNAQIASFNFATVNQLSAVSADVSQLRTDVFSAGFITANYITADVICSKFQSVDSGSITIGTVRAQYFQMYDGKNYQQFRFGADGTVRWKA